MNEVFIVSNWSGTDECAFSTYDSAKKYVLEKILEHPFDFEFDFEIGEDASREYYDTDEEYEKALRDYLAKGVENNVFFDEYTIDSIPFINE